MKSYRLRRIAALGLGIPTIIGTAGIAVMGTLALFSAEERGNSHLTAGSLSVSFTRTELKGKMPNPNNAILEDINDQTVVDLKQDNSKIFEVSNAVPGFALTAKLQLANTGSVAFRSVAQISNVELGQGDIADASAKLVDALEIRMYYVNASANEVSKEFKLADYASANSMLELPNLINNGDSQTFYVSVALPESVTEGQMGEISFDVHVTATQILTV